MCYGLLKMPRMPELKNRKIKGFKEDKSVNVNDIKYKDKQKEMSRQKKLAVYRETGEWPGAKKRAEVKVAWSEKVDQKERKRKRKEAKEKKKAEKEKNEEDEDEDDLEEDYRLLKKMRRGKVSQEEFDKKIELEAGEDDESS